MKVVYFYDIFFKKKWDDSDVELLGLLEKDIYILLKQLKNCSASFWWVMIFWIDNLENLKIIKRDFKEKDWNTYIRQFVINEIWETIEEDFETPFYTPEEINLTNELLYKYRIQGDDYKRKWKVLLEDGKFYVDSHRMTLTKGTKWFELFTLLMTARSLYKKNMFLYHELKKVYNESSITFKELKCNDISQTELNSFIGKKLKSIQNKLKIKDKCLDITSASVSIWQEKA